MPSLKPTVVLLASVSRFNFLNFKQCKNVVSNWDSGKADAAGAQFQTNRCSARIRIQFSPEVPLNQWKNVVSNLDSGVTQIQQTLLPSFKTCCASHYHSFSCVYYPLMLTIFIVLS